MNRIVLVFCFTLLFFNLRSQHVAGLWVGVFKSDMAKTSATYKFYLQLNQEGNAVWGVYTSGDSDIEKASCACRVTIVKSKRDSSDLMMFNDKVIAHKIAKSTCEALIYLHGNFSAESDTQYLSGKWYGIYRSIYRSDGASGDFSLVRVTNTNSEYINRYFPDLKKLIKTKNKYE